MGSVRANGFRPVGVDGAYAAFPSVCRFGSGRLRLVWRQGADHLDARDGQVYTSTSDDDGRTWSAAIVALADAADLRDPCVATAGGTTWLTYFKATSDLDADGCFLRVSTDDGVTWGSETRIDGQPYAAISAPLVQVGSSLLATYYGRNADDAFDSCWFASSVDGGATWTSQVVADGQASRRDFQEPWLIADDAEVWMFIRNGSEAAIDACVSTDGGATWTAPIRLFGDTSGRPAAVWLSTGTMAVVARRVSDKQPVVRSRDAGTATTDWLPPRPTMLQPSSGPIGMLYAHPLEIPGGVICPVGIETSASTARIHVGWLSDGGGISPLGDLIPDDRTAVAQGTDQVLFAEGFSQADGPLRAPWVVDAGGMRVSAGHAVSTAADNVPDLAWVDVAKQDVVLEGEFTYTGHAGFGLIARVVSANTYLLLTVESGGTAFRLYKVISGVAKQVAVLGTNVSPASWSTIHMHVRGHLIHCVLNGWSAFGYYLTGADAATFAGSARHGIKLNPQAGGVHLCRRFVVRS